VLVAAPERATGPADLAALPLIVRESGSGTRQAIAALLARRHLHLSDLRVVLELGSTEAVKRAVRAGAGHAFLSRLAVAEDVAARPPRLCEVPCPGLPIARRLYWVRRRDVTPGAAARRLIEIFDESHRPKR
jgi:DNA-binding transcriptional LysR family regulator